MHNIGVTELLLIFGIALLLFGNRLPQVGKAIGEGIRDFKRGLRDDMPEEQEKQNTMSQKNIQASTNHSPNLSQANNKTRDGVIDVQDVHHVSK